MNQTKWLALITMIGFTALQAVAYTHEYNKTNLWVAADIGVGVLCVISASINVVNSEIPAPSWKTYLAVIALIFTVVLTCLPIALKFEEVK